MAMYYQGSSENQADGLQTLYLMNPNYVGYSNTQHSHSANMALLNSPATTTTAVPVLNSTTVPHAPPLSPAQQFVGFPLSHDPRDDHRPSSALEYIHTTIPRYQNNIWGLADQTTTGNQTPKGLSLSLSTHQLTGFNKSLSSHQDCPGQLVSPKICSSPSATTSNGLNSMSSVIMCSKYLTAAQELLDEVVSLEKCTDANQLERSKDIKAKLRNNMKVEASRGGDGNADKSGDAEVTTAQRQEIQMKKAKLHSMLEEVEHRRRQYQNQMQMIVASFELVAGIGSAKLYTQLALKTILRQFRCLKAAISTQINILNKTLGEESLGGKSEGSRLKFIDQQLRQQRALQQLDMMHNNAWRTQRGLPERAVSVLRAWLFEHFLHPYPKDSDKQMMAKQTGLTRSQVSNWFINARVRLWKPMVEEMYLEEMKNHDQLTSSDDNTTKNGDQYNNVDLQFKQDKHMVNLVPSPADISASTTITNSPTGRAQACFSQLISPMNLENLVEKNPKRSINDDTQDNSLTSILSVEMEMKAGGDTCGGVNNIIKFSTDGQTRESYLSMAAANATIHGPGFGMHGIRELGRFNGEQLAAGFHGNNFSLTLALPPSESSQLSAAETHQQNFLSHRNFDYGTRIETAAAESSSSTRVNGIQSATSHPNIGYDLLDFQIRKPFPSQLLPDFCLVKDS